jgi:hypothetical protein
MWRALFLLTAATTYHFATDVLILRSVELGQQPALLKHCSSNAALWLLLVPLYQITGLLVPTSTKKRVEFMVKLEQALCCSKHRVCVCVCVCIYIYIYILRGFKTSNDAFRLSYSIAFDCSIRPFLDLFHSLLYIFHFSGFSGDGLVFSFLQASNES